MEMFQRFLKQPPSGYPSDDHTRTRLKGAIEEVVHEPPATVRAALTQKLPQLQRKLESEFKTVEDLPAHAELTLERTDAVLEKADYTLSAPAMLGGLVGVGLLLAAFNSS